MTRARAMCLALWLCGAFVCACGDDDSAATKPDAGDAGGKQHEDAGTRSDGGQSEERDAAPRDAAIDTGIVESTPGQCPGAGTPLPGLQCRSDADCNASNPQCLANALPPGCGACSPNAPRLCEDDKDCPADYLCNPIVESLLCPCNPDAPQGTRCESKCSSTSCPASQRCESDGRCHIRPCDDGWSCGRDSKCATKDESADEHGCIPENCATDDYVCPDDFVCGDGDGDSDGDGGSDGQNTDVHGCSEVSCSDGFTCAPNFDCDPKSKASHHCEKRACKADSDCDCGFCIQHHCEPRLFVCTGGQAP